MVLKGTGCLKLDPTPNPGTGLGDLPASGSWHIVSFWLVAPWSRVVGRDGANRTLDGIEIGKGHDMTMGYQRH